MIAKANLTANDAIIFDGYAAADAGLRGDDHALADVTVVPNVDQVVNLGSPPDACAAKSGAIDTSVRA